jgi:hypothetical protein
MNICVEMNALKKKYLAKGPVNIQMRLSLKEFVFLGIINGIAMVKARPSMGTVYTQDKMR